MYTAKMVKNRKNYRRKKIKNLNNWTMYYYIFND